MGRGGGQSSSVLTVEGYVPKPGENLRANLIQIGPQFFGEMGMPLLKGRGLTAADVFPVNGPAAITTRAVVINESMASKFFGNADPIGRHLGIYSLNNAEIVGVAPNSKYTNLRDEGLKPGLHHFAYPKNKSFFRHGAADGWESREG